MKTFRWLAMIGVAISWAMASQAGATGGVIHFVGAIAASPCTMEQNGATTSTTCYQQGQVITQQQTLANYKAGQIMRLPQNLGVTEMKWVDAQQKLAMVTATYN